MRAGVARLRALSLQQVGVLISQSTMIRRQ
nr:MAG TPA: activator of apoptosis [Caudoviricetes sp.]